MHAFDFEDQRMDVKFVCLVMSWWSFILNLLKH